MTSFGNSISIDMVNAECSEGAYAFPFSFLLVHGCNTWKLDYWNQIQQTFSVKDQIAPLFGFVGHVVSTATIQLLTSAIVTQKEPYKIQKWIITTVFQ